MDLLYFIVASFLVVVVPGPTVILIIANSLKSGMRAGILNVVGTQFGLIILIFLLALGFRVITPYLEDIIKVVRILGAVYCFQGGHQLSNLFLHKLIKSTSKYKIFKFDENIVKKSQTSKMHFKLAASA